MDTEIQFLRLKTGEDIISEVQETDSTYILMNPCKILYLKSQKTGFLSISLMQWIFSKMCKEQTFEMDKSEVLVKGLPDDTFIEHYWNSIDHFLNSESKDQIEYDDPTSDDSYEEKIELIKNMLGLKDDDKGSLH
jgi:hypothetical protein